MNRPALAVLFYAIIVFSGGYIGYQSVGSLPSLIMGTIFGTALGACAWAMFLGMQRAFLISLILTGFLFLFFTYRFLITIKFFPSGFLAIISLAFLVYLILVKKGTLPK